MRYLKIFCLLFLAAFLTQPVFAGQQNRDITRQELNNFDNFLDTHPAIEKDLKSNPALVKDSAYLSAHPELREFLANHPGVREEIRENPNGFMKRERHFEKKDDADNYHRVERAYGSFTRSFTLPNTVTAEGATADYSHGVLRVTIPKREETKARRIEIKAEEGSAPKTIEAKTETAKASAAKG